MVPVSDTAATRPGPDAIVIAMDVWPNGLRWRAGRWAIGLLVGALGSLSAAAVELGRGVLLDAERDQVIVSLQSRRLAALAIDDGARRWVYRKPARVVVVHNGLCLLQRSATPAGDLRLVTLDAGTGARRAQATSALPAGVNARLPTTATGSFDLVAVPRTRPLRLLWRFDARDTAAPKPLSQRGVLRVDVATAQAGPLDVRPPPWPAATADAAPDFGEYAYWSADRRHVIVSERVATDRGVSYRWQVYDRDRRRQAVINEAVRYARFVVHRDRLLVVGTPRRPEDGAATQQIRAWSMKDETEVWRAPLFDWRQPAATRGDR